MSDKQMNLIPVYFTIAALALACISLLGGCNTMAGLGRDISSAAKGIQDRMAEPADDRYSASR